MAEWERYLVEDEAGIRAILEECRRVAVLGIKTEAQAGQPAIEVPRYLAAQGYDVVPVPVYYPEAQEILGRPVYRRVADGPGGVDLVDVIPRPQDMPPHVDDLLAAPPTAVRIRLGLRNDHAAHRRAGADSVVVEPPCRLVERRRLVGPPGDGSATARDARRARGPQRRGRPRRGSEAVTDDKQAQRQKLLDYLVGFQAT